MNKEISTFEGLSERDMDSGANFIFDELVDSLKRIRESGQPEEMEADHTLPSGLKLYIRSAEIADRLDTDYTLALTEKTLTVATTKQLLKNLFPAGQLSMISLSDEKGTYHYVVAVQKH